MAVLGEQQSDAFDPAWRRGPPSVECGAAPEAPGSGVMARWEPILSGARAAEAEALVREIAEALARDGPPGGPADAASGVATHPYDLADGAAGVALFWCYAERAWPGSGSAERAIAELERSFGYFERAPRIPSLFNGMAGIAWAAHHVAVRLPEYVDGDPGGDLDRLLFAALAQDRYTGSFDLTRGIVGIGLYALSRVPLPGAERAVESVVRHLGRTAVRTPEGISWYTERDWVAPSRRTKYPAGFFDLGTGHGVAGVVAFLGLAHAAGLARRESGELLDGALRWLRAARHAAPRGSALPVIIADGRAIAGRNGWCYGDAGVAAALYTAAAATDDAALKAEARAIGRLSCLRPAEDHHVVDAGICHGAFGLAHIYNRLYRESADEAFRAASAEWIGRGLAMRTEGAGVAGFRGLLYYRGGSPRWKNARGLISGAAGIGLVLLSAALPIEPAWDQPLLTACGRPESNVNLVTRST